VRQVEQSSLDLLQVACIFKLVGFHWRNRHHFDSRVWTSHHFDSRSWTTRATSTIRTSVPEIVLHAVLVSFLLFHTSFWFSSREKEREAKEIGDVCTQANYEKTLLLYQDVIEDEFDACNFISCRAQFLT